MCGTSDIGGDLPALDFGSWDYAARRGRNPGAGGIRILWHVRPLHLRVKLNVLSQFATEFARLERRGGDILSTELLDADGVN
jgi:hypothetical protein